MPVHKMFQKHGDILRLQVCYLLVAGFWAQNSSQPTQPKPNQHTVHVRWGRVSRLCRVYDNTRSLGNPRKCHRRNVKKTRTRRKTLAWITFRPIMSSSFRHSRNRLKFTDIYVLETCVHQYFSIGPSHT